MKGLVLHLAKSLVDQPEAVQVEAAEEGETVRLTLRVAEEDKGKIIGKQGKVIKALRAVVGAAALKVEKKAVLDLQ